MRLLERLVLPLVALSPRQLFFLSVTVACLVMQWFVYADIWAVKAMEFGSKLNFTADCKVIQKTMPTSYAFMEEECKAATLVVKRPPSVAAFVELVNTTWPHPENLAKWTTAWVASLSYVTIIIAVVLFWVCWPLVAPRLNIVKEVINWGKDKKAKIEIDKLLENSQFRALMMNPVAGAPFRVMPPATMQ